VTISFSISEMPGIQAGAVKSQVSEMDNVVVETWYKIFRYQVPRQYFPLPAALICEMDVDII
jgi:hypothetical protein